MYYDKATGYLYVVPYTEVVAPDGTLHFQYWLRVLDTAGNQLTLHSSLKIADTSVSGSVYTFYAGTPIVPGTGDGAVIAADGASTVYFNAQKELQRPAITVGPDGTIYLGFGGHDDTRPYHGWLLGITGGADDLKVSYVFCTTPNGYEGALWNTGAPFTILPDGDILIQTGNGDFGDYSSGGSLNAAGQPANGDYGDSVVLLTPNLQIASFFTPSNQQVLEEKDLDLSDTQPILFEGHYLVTVGKEGTIYLLDVNNLGGYDPNGDQIVGELPDAIPSGAQGAVWSEPVLYPVITADGPGYRLFIGGAGSQARTFDIAMGAGGVPYFVSATPTSISAGKFAYPGPTLAISSNNGANGMVWAVDFTTKQLLAFTTAGFNQPLIALPLPMSPVKFVEPVIANGQIIVAGNGGVVIYGLPSSQGTDGLSNFVSGLYENLLNRPAAPTESGFVADVAALQNGSSTPAAIIASLLASNEYRSNLVQSFYQKYLGRAGSAAEVAGWVNDLDSGATVEDIILDFVSSPEYFARQGLFAPSWIAALYSDLLGRLPTSAEVAGTMVQYNQDGGNLTATAQGFLTSRAYLSEVVYSDYWLYLKRAPDSAEIQQWVPELQAGVRDEVVAASIGSSLEALNDSSNFVRDLYERELYRVPTAAELSVALAEIQNGMALQQLALAVQDSDEQRSLFVASLYQTYLDRSGTASEIAGWVQLMDNGVSQTQIKVDFLASSEYYSNKGSASGWISAVYSQVLGRAASPSEINLWLGVLAGTGNRYSVARGILGSPEYATDAIIQGYNAVLQRCASAAEIQNWLAQFEQGLSYDNFVAALEASSDFAGVMSFALGQDPQSVHFSRRQ